MKVVTILGTRPELIRLSRIIPKLDEYCEHIIVHTGQNYDYTLDKIFRDELNIREPDYYLDARGAFSVQLAQIFTGLEEVLIKEKPDAFLVLGDTNSSMGAIIAKRMGIRVFHMEAGNRCHDERSPEEVNRRIIDHCSDILMPYTENSRRNLLDEGIPGKNIYVTGNPIKEVMDYYTTPDPFNNHESKVQLYEPFYLVTLHRQENVDDPERLANFVKAINALDKKVVWPMHPRTKKQLKDKLGKHVDVMEPLGFLDFIKCEKMALCVLTDSGTVQEECAILGTSVVTLRDTTERPETIEMGTNMITGNDPEDIARAVKLTIHGYNNGAPLEYLRESVSDTVAKIVLGHYQ